MGFFNRDEKSRRPAESGPVSFEITSDDKVIYDIGSILKSESARKHLEILKELVKPDKLPASSLRPPR